jgi:hypothetical protein
MHFSKTQIIGGLQCEKQLWLRVHNPELMEPVESPATVTGRVVQQHARLEFPDAVLVERDRASEDAFAQTDALLKDPSVGAILEAGIRGNGLEVFVDVLERVSRGPGASTPGAAAAWELTEIKGATSVKDAHIDDVATQALALERAGIVVKRFRLMHIDAAFIYRGEHDYHGLFVREDITEQVIAHRPFIAQRLATFQALIVGPQPARRIGSHCNNPYPCPFRSHCEAHDAEYPLAWLPNGAAVARKLLARGIVDIRDIPAEQLNSEVHQRVRRVTIQGEAELLPGAARELNALAFPRYYLDFECIQFAIPIWAGTRPYQQLPFQWSCHVQGEAGALEHREFLDIRGDDPRRDFAATLLAACGDGGPIIVYNQSFEKNVIRDLAAVFPDLAGPLLALNERVFDLLPVVRHNYYHPDMKGSWSIKSVLPCLVPELSYARLGSVQEGTRAQAAYLDLIGGELDEAAREALSKDLRAYCELDTLAMVRIVERLCA